MYKVAKQGGLVRWTAKFVFFALEKDMFTYLEERARARAGRHCTSSEHIRPTAEQDKDSKETNVGNVSAEMLRSTSY